MLNKHIFILVILANILLIFYGCSFTGPMYEPGKLSKLMDSPNIPNQHETGYWRVEEEIKLYHFSEGNGKNILVIHGGPGIPTQKPWIGLKELSETHMVHYYHQRGCGKSTLPFNTFDSNNFYKNMKSLEGTLGLGAQISDIERIRKILGDEKLTIIGHSFGGLIAALYAAEFPENVEKLVLVNPASLIEMPTPYNLFDIVRNGLSKEEMEDYDKWIEDYFNYKTIFSQSEANLSKLNDRFGYFWSIVYENSGLRIPKNMDGKSGGWMVHAINFSMGNKHTYQNAIRKIRIPTLIIHGNDDLIPAEASEVYHQLIQNSSFEIIQNSGHFPQEENSELFSKSIIEFIK